MPCRNAQATLDEAMASLVGQSLTDIEIVAVDDGSTDKTPQGLAEWARRDDRIRVVQADAQGIVGALNLAARHAGAPLLARMDADDIAEPSRLKLQAAFLERRRDIAACGTRVRYFPRQLVRDGARRYERWINGLVEAQDIERDLFVECPIPHPTLVVRRSVFERLGGYRTVPWAEDYDFILRLSRTGHRLAKVPEVLLWWRERPDRLSRIDARYSAAAFRRCKIHFLTARIGERPIVICGAGPVGKAFALDLQDAGHEVAAFIDLDPRKVGQTIHGAPVVTPADAAAYGGAYYLAAVASEQARWEIRHYLTAARLDELRDFCAVA